MREKILKELPTDKSSAISTKDIIKKGTCGSHRTSIASSLTFLHMTNHVEREKKDREFYYWRITPDSTSTTQEVTIKYLNATDFIMDNLFEGNSKGRSIDSLHVLGKDKYTLNALWGAMNRLHNRREVQMFKEKGVLYYYLPLQGPKLSLSSSTEELLTQYKEDNKNLDKRIANIEKQIRELKQKQELDAEIQKRDENEKRLAELEEQLHKISAEEASINIEVLH